MQQPITEIEQGGGDAAMDRPERVVMVENRGVAEDHAASLDLDKTETQGLGDRRRRIASQPAGP